MDNRTLAAIVSILDEDFVRSNFGQEMRTHTLMVVSILDEDFVRSNVLFNVPHV